AGGPSNGATRSPVPGRARSSAATAWCQNRAGSLSPASSDSHATGRSPRRAQSASRTVLPYPAGALARISPRARPSSSRAVSRGRSTWPGRGPGMCSLVASRTSGPGAVTGDSTITYLHALASPRPFESLQGRIYREPACAFQGAAQPFHGPGRLAVHQSPLTFGRKHLLTWRGPAGFDPATRCLEGTCWESREVAWSRPIWPLAALIVAGRGSKSPWNCRRWLPFWLPRSRCLRLYLNQRKEPHRPVAVAPDAPRAYGGGTGRYRTTVASAPADGPPCIGTLVENLIIR